MLFLLILSIISDIGFGGGVMSRLMSAGLFNSGLVKKESADHDDGYLKWDEKATHQHSFDESELRNAWQWIDNFRRLHRCWKYFRSEGLHQCKGIISDFESSKPLMRGEPSYLSEYERNNEW